MAARTQAKLLQRPAPSLPRRLQHVQQSLRAYAKLTAGGRGDVNLVAQDEEGHIAQAIVTLAEAQAEKNMAHTSDQ